MGQPLVFYELTNTLEFGQRSWSPNCWKTRFVLNYKRISYKTVWVHFADVQTAMKAIGAEATSTMADGSPRYTLPTIFDPNTSKFVSDSLEIAKYLDKHYPERQVVPAGSEEELSKFAGNFFPNFGMDLLKIAGYGSYQHMDPRDQAALERSIREHDRGPPLAERIPGDEHWKGLEQALDRLAHVDLLNRQGRPAGDDSLTFTDFLVASFLKWLNASVSDDQFERVLQWNGGRWKALMNQVKPYSTIDQGESYN